MSRPIKFRGKRLDNGEWVYGYYLRRYQILEGEVRDVIATASPTKEDSGLYIVDPTTVGQYTGLKDKNGREIYEGDVIKGDSYPAVGEIVFNDGSFWIITKDWTNVLGGMNHDLEIIGTIHDNPEILK